MYSLTTQAGTYKIEQLYTCCSNNTECEPVYAVVFYGSGFNYGYTCVLMTGDYESCFNYIWENNMKDDRNSDPVFHHTNCYGDCFKAISLSSFT